MSRCSKRHTSVVEIDPDGEVITGYIIADNYLELYVNGRLIGVDPVPYTPFNSVVVAEGGRGPQAGSRDKLVSLY